MGFGEDGVGTGGMWGMGSGVGSGDEEALRSKTRFISASNDDMLEAGRRGKRAAERERRR